MEDDVRKRIVQFLEDEKGTSVSAFAKSKGENQSKMTKQIKNSTAISLYTILLLMEEYPDLSAEWLLRGTGSMLLTEPQHEIHTRHIRDDSETEELRERLRRAEREIDGLYERIKELKGDIATTHLSVATA